MSVITDVLIIPRDNFAGPGPCAWLEHIREYRHDDRIFRVNPVTEAIASAAGGHKVWCMDTYAGSFNYLPIHDYIDHIKAAPWDNDSWLMLIDHEHKDYIVVVGKALT